MEEKKEETIRSQEEPETNNPSQEEVKTEAPSEKEEAKPEESNPEDALKKALNSQESKSEYEDDGEYNGKDGKDNEIDHAYFHSFSYPDSLSTFDSQIIAISNDSYGKLKKNSVFNALSMVLMLVAFVMVLLVTFLLRGRSDLAWVTWVVLGVAIVLIVVSLIFSSITRKKREKVMNEYLDHYQTAVNGYVLMDMNVENPVIGLSAKLNDHDIINAHYFRTIESIESRCVVEGKRNGHEFRYAEAAVRVPAVSSSIASKKPEDLVNLDGSVYVPKPVGDTTTGTTEIAASDMTLLDLDLSDEATNQKEADKRKKDIEKMKTKDIQVSTGLFGKYFAYDMKVPAEESLIVSYLGEPNNTYLPTHTTGYSPVHVPGLRSSIVVYATDPRKASRFLDEEGVNRLNAIEPNMVVQSAFISINPNGSFFALTLSDDIMRLPNKTLKTTGAFDAYKKATLAGIHFLDYVEEKK